ncbi:hypothetical protein PJM28_29165, partial [Mycobacterium kansasii]
LFQYVSNYSFLGIVGTTTFASNIAEVDVYESDIPATDISISGDDYVVNPTTSSTSSSSVTSQYTSTTNPSNATGEITW